MIVAVVGTGTGVGKTTASIAMIRALARTKRVGAWKPIETGGDADGRALAEAAGSDAGPTIVLREPVAPSVAARMEGRSIEIADLAEEVHQRADAVEVLVVELPGGLYSPIDDRGRTNAELLVAMRVDLVILVAPNRLGVLHDVEVCRRAMAADRIELSLVVLSGRADDPSVATNATEIRDVDVVELRTPTSTDALDAWLTERLATTDRAAQP